MAKRPVGIYLVCLFFVLVGISTFLGGFSLSDRASQIPAGQPASVELFLSITPAFMILLGALGVLTGVLIWRAAPLGVTAGLVWLVLWIIEEIVAAIWTQTGPEIVQEAAGGIGGNLIRILIAGIIFYYLFVVGRRYVGGDIPFPDRLIQ